MTMKLTGKLIKILPVQQGDTARGHWVRGGFVIEYGNEYPKQAAITVNGEDKVATLVGLNIGDQVTVTFTPESREFNERWYTDLKMVSLTPALP